MDPTPYQLVGNVETITESFQDAQAGDSFEPCSVGHSQEEVY